MKPTKKVFAFSFLAFLLLNVCTAEGQNITGTVIAVDRGDLLKVNDEGQIIEVALYGIDCPNTSQPFGLKAQQFAARLAKNKKVSIQVYRRQKESMLAGNVILPDNRILNHELLKKGFAFWDRQEEPGNARLQTFETLAREMEAGLWSSRQATPGKAPTRPEGRKKTAAVKTPPSPPKASSKTFLWLMIISLLILFVLLLIIFVLLAFYLKKSPAKPPVPGEPAHQAEENLPQKFDLAQGQAEAIESSRKTIQELLNSMAEFINGLVENNSSYSDQMDGYKNQIQNAMTKAGLEETKRLLLLEISQIEEDNEKHRKELGKANQTITEQQKIMEEIRLDAQLDFLTKIANRRAFDSRLTEEFERSKRYGGTFSLIMFDIDHFKQVNDNYSHMAGDKTLQLVATILQEQTRVNDIVARYGGEEFAVLLPQTKAEDARIVANKIREKVEINTLRHGSHKIKVTISSGVGEFIPPSDTLETFIQRVDAALYRAKEKGRNRVEMATLKPPAPSN